MTDRMERLEQIMDKLTDKVDEVLSVLGDIRANEKLNEHRFLEVERRHNNLEKTVDERLKKLHDGKLSKEEFTPYKRAMTIVATTVTATLCAAVLALVLNQPAIISKQGAVKPPAHQSTEGE